MGFQTKYISYDIEKIIHRADLEFPLDSLKNIPENLPKMCIVEDCKAQLPFANGRFGTPVWTDGQKICMQPAHTDFLPFGAATTARVFCNEAEYGCGLAWFTVDFGQEILKGGTQYIDYYRGVCGYRSASADITLAADRDRDLLCIHIADKRKRKEQFEVILKAPHFALEQNGNHRSETRVYKAEGNAMLDTVTREVCDTGIRENDTYCRGTLGVYVEMNPTNWHRIQYDRTAPGEVRLKVLPDEQTKDMTIYLAGAVSQEETSDTNREVLDCLRYVRGTVSGKKVTFSEIAEKTADWFREFWGKSFIQLDEQNQWLDATGIFWVRLLYEMALTKFGNYPPLHQANPLYGANLADVWGQRIWWFNNGRYEYGMNLVNHSEMNDPLFRMIEKNYAKYQNAARQYWGSRGIYIQEVTYPDGMEIYPTTYTEELRRWYVSGEIPGEDFCELQKKRIPEMVIKGKLGQGDYTMRFCYDTGDIAELYRLRYLYECDMEFLKEKAYPILRDAAEFYRNNPILQKKEDGKYHIFPTNYAETYWGAADVIDDVSMIKSLFPVAADYAQALGVDAELIPVWREIAENMCDFVTAKDADCLSPRWGEDKSAGFAMCREPVYEGYHSWVKGWIGCPQDEQIRPVMDYDLVTHETKDEKLKKLCMNTLEGNLILEKMKEGSGVLKYVLDRFGTNCARLGRQDLAFLRLPLQFCQMMDLKQPSYEELQHFTDLESAYGTLSYKSIYDLQDWVYEEAIMECLLGCCPKGDDRTKNVIYIAPAWNRKYDAKFLLAVRDGFEVCCEIKDGAVRVVEIYSKCGKTCVVRNTFDKSVTVEFPDDTERLYEGDYIEFPTEKGMHYCIKVNME